MFNKKITIWLTFTFLSLQINSSQGFTDLDTAETLSQPLIEKDNTAYARPSLYEVKPLSPLAPFNHENFNQFEQAIKTNMRKESAFYFAKYPQTYNVFDQHSLCSFARRQLGFKSYEVYPSHFQGVDCLAIGTTLTRWRNEVLEERRQEIDTALQKRSHKHKKQKKQKQVIIYIIICNDQNN